MSDDDFKKLLLDFRENYWDLPIHFFVTGGGFSIFRLLEIPGCSRFIGSITAPYSKDSLLDYVIFYKSSDYGLIGQCNKEATELYNHNMKLIHPDEANLVIVNSALTTTRQRKGTNRSHIIINDQYHYLEFPSSLRVEDYEYYPERIDTERQDQDRQISAFVLQRLLELK